VAGGDSGDSSGRVRSGQGGRAGDEPDRGRPLRACREGCLRSVSLRLQAAFSSEEGLAPGRWKGRGPRGGEVGPRVWRWRHRKRRDVKNSTTCLTERSWMPHHTIGQPSMGRANRLLAVLGESWGGAKHLPSPGLAP
jgi:hypothetical protein